MKKKILTAAFLFLVAANLSFAKEKILHAETIYFDIIFDEDSRESAKELYGCADEILKDLCFQYNVEPDFKIPLVITSKTENYNAYFTNYNYNHIVLFDTVPEESMLEFSSTIKSTFIHELTHLVSNNARNKFWRTAGTVLGDVYNPGYYLTMTSFFKEGASVAQESMDGEGRLNDGFFLHDIRQAKLSNKFPGYTDSFGARTIYPYGNTSYLFGSAFTEHIIKKYGMEKYAEFWHKGTNSNRLTSTAVFKKTYGVSMKKEWKDFQDSIDVEGIEKDPARVAGIEKAKFKNKELHLYSVLGIKNDKAVVLDKTANTVYIGNKKAFTKASLVSAKLSDNSKYISVTSIDDNHLEEKIKAEYFNTETGRWKSIDGKGIKQLSIFEKDGKEFLACVKGLSQKSTLEIKPLIGNEAEILSVEFSSDEIPFSLRGDGKGNLWFFLKEKMNFSLCRLSFDSNGMELKSFNLGKLRPRGLFISENAVDKDDVGKTTILFSYVDGKTFPRLAVAEYSDEEINLILLQKDISGGIYSPVLNRGNILYAAKFYTEGAIYQLNFASFIKDGSISSSIIKASSKQLENTRQSKNHDDDDEFDFSEYKKVFYNGKTIVPVSVLNSYYISPSVYFSDEEDCLGKPYSYLLGLTVIKNNPRDTRHLAVTAGYSPYKKSGGAGLILMGKSLSGNFNVTNISNSIFDKDGFMQANNKFTGSIKFQTGNISSIILSETNFLLYGKDDMNNSTREKYLLKEEQLNKNYFYDKNTLSLHYTTMHKTGARSHETAGFTAGINFKNVYATVDAEKKDSIFNRMLHYENDRILFSQLYPSLEISFPKLIPVDCKGAFTYNLPVKLYGSLFQFNDSFLTYITEVKIFSWEIQKGFGPVPLYASTLTFNAFFQDEHITNLNRNMEILYFREDLDHINEMGKNRYAGGSIVLIIGGNTGALANSGINVAVSGKVFHCLEGTHKGETKFTVTSAMNFALF